MRFTVGLKHKGKVNHVVVEAANPLIAALKAKTEHPEALVMCVRPQNRRGDARHPPLTRAKDKPRTRHYIEQRGEGGGQVRLVLAWMDAQTPDPS